MSEEMGQNRSNSEFCPICRKGAASGRRQMSDKMGQNCSNSKFCPICRKDAAPWRRQMSEKMGQKCSNSEFCPILKKVAALGRPLAAELSGVDGRYRERGFFEHVQQNAHGVKRREHRYVVLRGGAADLAPVALLRRSAYVARINHVGDMTLPY